MQGLIIKARKIRLGDPRGKPIGDTGRYLQGREQPESRRIRLSVLLEEAKRFDTIAHGEKPKEPRKKTEE